MKPNFFFLLCFWCQSLGGKKEKSREFVYLPVFEDYSPTAREVYPGKMDPNWALNSVFLKSFI